MDKQQARIAQEFLLRTEIKGHEVPRFASVMAWLENIINDVPRGTAGDENPKTS